MRSARKSAGVMVLLRWDDIDSGEHLRKDPTGDLLGD